MHTRRRGFGPSGGLQDEGDLTTPKLKAVISTSVVTPSDVASTEISAIHTRHQKYKPVARDSRALRSKGPEAWGKNGPALFHKHVSGVTPRMSNSTYTESILLTRI